MHNGLLLGVRFADLDFHQSEADANNFQKAN
jgi:hypothetical protein